jgi:hypothetical protein
MPHCCECYWTAPQAREDDNNGRGDPCHTWSAWDLVLDWAMAGRLATPPIHCTNSSLRRQVDMLFHHPPQVRTVSSYSPWLPESRSICMFPSGRVEMMHGKAYRGGFPCVTNFWDFQMWHHNMIFRSNKEILFHQMIISPKSLVFYRYFNWGQYVFWSLYSVLTFLSFYARSRGAADKLYSATTVVNWSPTSYPHPAGNQLHVFFSNPCANLSIKWIELWHGRRWFISSEFSDLLFCYIRAS